MQPENNGPRGGNREARTTSFLHPSPECSNPKGMASVLLHRSPYFGNGPVPSSNADLVVQALVIRHIKRRLRVSEPLARTIAALAGFKKAEEARAYD